MARPFSLPMPHLTEQLPSALRANARWERLGPANVPAMLVHPDWTSSQPVPVVIWMHGRTAHKELDPGRYLRWMRAGLAVCALDLPGHGERAGADDDLQSPSATLEVVARMVDELDQVVDALAAMNVFDMDRLGIGGMSAGGLATMVRLCRGHPFTAASVEATTGSWRWQAGREMFEPGRVERLNPVDHLERWRAIPFQAIHAAEDEWAKFEGQREFIDALGEHYAGRGADPGLIELIVYPRTGARHEHIGFGRFSAEAKAAQAAFFRRELLEARVRAGE